MFFSKHSLSFALTLCFATADATPESTPVGTLYAYGSGLSGLPVIYSDGVAVLGWGQPSVATVATNLTFTYSNTSLIAEPNNTAIASNWTTPLLYIETRQGAKSDVAFTAIKSPDKSSNTSRATTGFEFYGRQLLWMGDEDAGAGRSFWASPLKGDDGFYKLFWNADNAALEDAVPVAIKRLPPPSLPDRV